MIDILFFERTLADLRKFAFKISNEIKALDDSIRTGVVTIEMPDSNDVNKVDEIVSRRDISDIDSFLLDNGVRVIVFTQTRIPDMEFILHAKHLGIKTIMIQEGVMFDGMNINDVSVSNAFALLAFIPKVAEYFHILWDMCKYDHKSFAKTVWHFLKKKKNVTLVIAKEFSHHLIGDYVLTMGEFWEDYYTKEHGYDKSQIRLIGDHDLDGFTRQGNNEEGICYIANVLVEDGTVPEKDFRQFLQIMADTISKETKLYIKLHPRSEKSLYDIFNNHNVEFIRTGTLPSVNLYIGHRSALLGRALYESDNLIIWRFACEAVCFYEKFATSTCTTKEEFERAVSQIDLKTHKNDKLKAIEKVYWNNPNGSMRSAACLINDYMNGIKI